MRAVKLWSGIAILLMLVFLIFGRGWLDSGPGDHESERVVQDNSAVWDAFARHQSNVWLEARGQVVRLVSDDSQGDRHQRFVIDVGQARMVLIAHNIDRASRVPVRKGTEGI